MRPRALISRAFLSGALVLSSAGCLTRSLKSGQPAPIDECAADNTTPMFGYNQYHLVNPCDQTFISEIDRKTGGRREQTILDLRALGYKALESDPSTAIKRFNQAWLLDRNDPEAFRAFTEWELRMGHKERADQFRDRRRILEKF